MMRIKRSRTSVIFTVLGICACLVIVGRTVIHVTTRTSERDVALVARKSLDGDRISRQRQQETSEVWSNPDVNDTRPNVMANRPEVMAQQGHRNIPKSLQTMYESIKLQRQELKQLRHNKTFRLAMRTEMADIKKEGWDEDNLLEPCRKRKYGDVTSWPKASVIIAFCDNELLVDVLHTVHSIVQRSPDVLLHEIILVDDNSVKDDFRETFHFYCSAIFGEKVKIIRSEKNLGLIQARLLGSRAASGDVIVSMDAHMEVQDTWLEALIWEIRENRQTLATAALDWMLYNPRDGWTYRTGFSSFMCTFGWSLGFGFGYSRPEIEQAWKRDNVMAIPSPCTVGTIWAIEKRFFHEIGELDDGMEKWGGENLDLAIRTWLFGGRAVQVPCSHAAHLERPHQRDYRFGWDESTNRNYKRVIAVWFDEYEHNVYMDNPTLKDVHPGDISQRLELKKHAIHNFTWFLDNVFPELGVYDRKTVGYGWARNLGLDKCLHRVDNKPLMVWQCHGEYKKEGLFLTIDGYLRTDLQAWHASDNKKIGSGIGPEGATGTYHDSWLSQWIHWKDGPMMLYEADAQGASRSLCMEGFENQTVSLQKCNNRNENQLWQWKIYAKDYDDVIKYKYHTKYHKELLRVKIEWENSKVKQSRE